MNLEVCFRVLIIVVISTSVATTNNTERINQMRLSEAGMMLIVG